MYCCFLFVCLLVYVMFALVKTLEKLVVNQYGKLLLTRNFPYQLLLLQLFSYMALKECLLPKSTLQLQVRAITFFTPQTSGPVPVTHPTPPPPPLALVLKAIQRTPVLEI